MYNKFKSVIIFKNWVYVPDENDIAEELKKLGISDTYKDFAVIAALSPIFNNVFSDIQSWEFSLSKSKNGEKLPEWYDEKDARERTLSAVKAWAETHIFENENIEEITSGSGYYLNNCRVGKIGGNAKIMFVGDCSKIDLVTDSSQIVDTSDNCFIELVNMSAKIYTCGGNTNINRVSDLANIFALIDDAVVETAEGNSIITYAKGYSVINNLIGEAAVKNLCDFANVAKAENHSKIDIAYYSSSVHLLTGAARIKYLCGEVIEMREFATVDVAKGDAVIHKVSNISRVHFLCENAKIIETDGYDDLSPVIVCDNARAPMGYEKLDIPSESIIPVLFEGESAPPKIYVDKDKETVTFLEYRFPYEAFFTRSLQFVEVVNIAKNSESYSDFFDKCVGRSIRPNSEFYTVKDFFCRKTDFEGFTEHNYNLLLNLVNKKEDKLSFAHCCSVDSYRGKLYHTDEWLYGELVKSGDEYFVKSENGTGDKVYTNTIGKDTCVTDIHNKKVYTGDIVDFCGMKGIVTYDCGTFGICFEKVIDWDIVEKNIKEITGCDNKPNFCYNDNFISLWELMWNYNTYDDNSCPIEVIGNIYDTPDLV